LLTDSIKLRLRSDVPVGSCLSGGIDSSTIASVIGGKFDVKDWEVYTAAYKDENHTSDERKYSKKVNLKYSFTERLVFPDGSKLIDSLIKLAWYEEEPFGSASMFAEAEIMKAANRNGIKVLLSGQGGDEALIGYDIQLLSYLILLLRNGKLTRFLSSYRKLAKNSCLKKMYLAKGLIYYFIPLLYHKKVLKTACVFINDKFNKNIWGVKSIWESIKDACSEQDLKRIFIKFTTLPSNLHSEDRNSMAYSIESRTPFVDYRIMEFGYSMPFEYLIEKGWTKAIIREAFQDLVPPEILQRKDKIGFETPESIWLSENRAHIIEFFNIGLQAEKYLDKEKILSLVEKQGSEIYIWKALIVEAWARAFRINP
jgi:asparagine synthase (glutamine-hydrolysing)